MRIHSHFTPFHAVIIGAVALLAGVPSAGAQGLGSVDYLCEDADEALEDDDGELFCEDESEPFESEHFNAAAFGQASGGGPPQQGGSPLILSLPAGSCATPATYSFVRDEVASMTKAMISGVEVARFTDGCYTAGMTGPERSFTWSGGTHGSTVRTTTWLRTLPRPYAYTGTTAYSTAEISQWLDEARGVNCGPTGGGQADLLDFSFEYDEGSPTVRDTTGQLVSSDAAYGSGADFYDYLGLPWLPPDRTTPRQPDPKQYGTIDCSGFIRLVWGYRDNFPFAQGYDAKVPLTYAPAGGTSISRNSWEMYGSGPGRILVSFRSGSSPSYGSPSAEELSRLLPGDMVFFDTKNTVTTNPNYISHMGMYVGTDSLGNHRFLSSRDSLNGPTMGDNSVWSVLNASSGHVYYALRFRAARRF